MSQPIEQPSSQNERFTPWRNEFEAAGEGHGKFAAELRTSAELGALSIGASVIDHEKDENARARANARLVDGLVSILPPVGYTRDDRSYYGRQYGVDNVWGFKIDNESNDSLATARILQANAVWLKDAPLGSFNPGYILGRSIDKQNDENTNLLVAKKLHTLNRYYVVKVRTDDLAVRDELTDKRIGSPYPEDVVQKMLGDDKNHISLIATTPGSFKFTVPKRRQDRKASAAEYVPENGIRVVDEASLKKSEDNKKRISDEMMEDFNIMETLARMAHQFGIADDFNKFLSLQAEVSARPKELEQPAQSPEHSDTEATRTIEALTEENLRLKEALTDTLAASGLFSREEIEERIEKISKEA